MVDRTYILWGVAAPTIVALAALLVSWRPWRRDGAIAGGYWGGLLAFGGAFVVGYARVNGSLRFPPLDADGWIWFAMLPVMVMGILDALWRVPLGLRAGVVFVVLAILVGLVLRPLTVTPMVSPRGAVVWAIVLAAAGTLWWVAMDALALRARGASIPLVLAIVTIGSAMVIANSASITVAHRIGIIIMPLLVAVGVGAVSHQMSIARGGIFAVATILIGFLVYARFYVDVPWKDVALLMVAPCAAWVGEVKWLSGWGRSAARVLLVLFVLAPAVIPAGKGLMQTMREQTESYQY